LLITIVAGSFFAIQNSTVQTFIIKKITDKLSAQLNATISIGKVDIEFFDKIILNDVLIEGKNQDTILYTQFISAKIDTLKFKKQRIILNELTFENSNIELEVDTANRYNFIYILDSLQTGNGSSKNWKINCYNFGFLDTKISYKNFYTKKSDNFHINNLNLNISNFENFKDSVQFKINSLNFNDGKKLFLEQLSANITTTSNLLSINELNLKSKYSEINNSNIQIQLNKTETNKSPEIDFHLNNSKVSFLELSGLIPSLKGMNQTVKISGRVYGDINDLKGKNIVLETGQNTNAILDFYINGIDNPETMYLFFDLKQSQTTFADISQVRLPKSSAIKYIEFPESFYDAGTLSFTGNFSGFLTDFVTFGTLNSKMGTLTTDLSLIPNKNGVISYRGNISTTDFNIGELLNDSVFGNVTFKGKADGDFDKKNQTLSGFFKGNIAEIGINDYVYRNIKLEGLLSEKMFDGLIAINDSNLQFAFLGQFDLNPKIPVFNFNLELDKILLENLNFSDNFPDAEMAFKMKANFTGDKLDNLKGSLILNDGYYKNRNGQFEFKGVELKSVPGDSLKTLPLTSDYFDIEIDGKYHFQSLLYAIKNDIKKFFPSAKFEVPETEEINDFNYRLNAKNLDEFTKVFAPDFRFETPFLLYGSVNSETSDFELAGSIPGFLYKNLLFRNIFIYNKTIDNQFSSKFRFGTIEHRNGYKVYDFTVESLAENNILNNEIHWNNNPDSTSSSTIKTQSTLLISDTMDVPAIKIEGFASDIYIADTAWHMDPFTAVIRPKSLEINNFNFYNNKQKLSIDGNITGHKPGLLSLDFKNIDLSYLEKYLDKKVFLAGTINGSIGISDLYGQPALLSDITIDSLQFKDISFGTVSLLNKWDQQNEAINTELTINNGAKQSLFASGFYYPKTNQLDYTLNADSLSLTLLGAAIRSNLSEFEGDITGIVKIGGSFDKLTMDGAVMARNAGLTIDYTKAHYTFNDSVYFMSDTILFDNIEIADIHKNKGKFNGTLTHQTFKNMVYDLSLTSDRIMVMDNTPVDNEQFYGEAFCNGKFTITGKGLKIALGGTFTTMPGTDLKISMEYENSVEQYDFIKFVTHKENKKKNYFFEEEEEKSEFTIALTFEVTPEAKLQLIYNSQIGDIIKAQGEGILLLKMDKDENISLSGDYTVTKGEYLFTLKNVLNKRFSIDQGGTIVWSGDPYNAIINITAVYKLKAALNDLMMESSLVQGEDIYQRILVECKILLSEELINPVINFQIDFPDEDESLKGILQQYINTEEEMNKQILSLIVMGKFYTPEYLRGTYNTSDPNALGNTASELFSNQLSNWLSQISNNVDVGFNYRPGNSITNDEIELALSTQIFNDRVILNGNIGNNVNPESSNSSQIVGDFDIKVKLVPSGKIMFKAFNRSNNDLIYDTAPYTQGIGFSFKEEYDTFNDLLRKIGSIFKKKK
jgi:hypothetical protein